MHIDVKGIHSSLKRVGAVGKVRIAIAVYDAAAGLLTVLGDPPGVGSMFRESTRA